MLDFDEEIKKFQPSLEVEDAEDAIYNNDVPDITDLITKITNAAAFCQRMTYVLNARQTFLYIRKQLWSQIYTITRDWKRRE